jgi:serine phosphatase RsbU (regulator of sigma subunit)
MGYKIFKNLRQSLGMYKAMWLLRMKSRVKSKFIFFALPVVLIVLFLRVYGTESQQDTIFPILSGLLALLFLFYFRKTEKINIIITKQKEELSIQKNIIEAQKTEVEIAKLIIEEKNKAITDSITYAKRIQEAKLPKKEEIYSSFPQSFILFKPKDIVSGDFYFFYKKNRTIFIASADCTGHGIPGAFMSLIGSEKLEDAVLQFDDTSEILKQLNIGIKTSLKQSESEESTRDGMDIAICSVDTETRVLRYAGANRPIWLIRKGQTEVEETKATKKAIGGLTEDNQNFDTHEFKLKQGDTFYIFTDGYVDQFNDKNKKLLTRNFKEMLPDIQDKPMQEQEKYLDDFIENWKAGSDQVDDILVIGVRL